MVKTPDQEIDDRAVDIDDGHFAVRQKQAQQGDADEGVALLRAWTLARQRLAAGGDDDGSKVNAWTTIFNG